MKRLLYNLPPLHSLGHFMAKREGFPVVKPAILPSISSLRRTRSGNKISRFFRHIFEYKRINVILGSNLALAFIASSFLPQSATSAFDTEYQADKIIITDSVNLKTERGIQYPVKEVKLNQGYSLFHPGVDFDGESGDPIFPIISGRVEAVQYVSSGINPKGILSLAYGNAVLVRHGNTLQSLYAHLSKIAVKEGQLVNPSTKIGEMGSTGRSTGSHLHLEVRQNGYPISPYSILPR